MSPQNPETPPAPKGQPKDPVDKLKKEVQEMTGKENLEEVRDEYNASVETMLKSLKSINEQIKQISTKYTTEVEGLESTVEELKPYLLMRSRLVDAIQSLAWENRSPELKKLWEEMLKGLQEDDLRFQKPLLQIGSTELIEKVDIDPKVRLELLKDLMAQYEKIFEEAMKNENVKNLEGLLRMLDVVSQEIYDLLEDKEKDKIQELLLLELPLKSKYHLPASRPRLYDFAPGIAKEVIEKLEKSAK